MDISFIILNYKSKGLIKNCLKSIIKSDLGGLRYEIIVVDNNSGDGIKKMLQDNFSGITFIQSRSNLGMGAGNNLGIKNAKGKYAVVLNPDTMINNSAFEKMFYFMEKNPQIGLAGPKLINPDKSLQYTRCCFPDFLIPIYRRTPLKKLSSVKEKIDKYLTRDRDYSHPGRADWLYGACFFIRAKAMEKVGLFDERFFLGFEDTD
ncbi:MAG: glycosyltransferase family 2 protein, partial [Patescibacteria group bacterium]